MLTITPIQTWTPGQELLPVFQNEEVWFSATIIRVPFLPELTELNRATISAAVAAEYMFLEWSPDRVVWTPREITGVEIYPLPVPLDAQVQVAFDETGIPSGSFLRLTVKAGAPWMDDTGGRQCAGGIIVGEYNT